jgi:hypothetical protein
VNVTQLVQTKKLLVEDATTSPDPPKTRCSSSLFLAWRVTEVQRVMKDGDMMRCNGFGSCEKVVSI